jgi:hypothetical protein
VGWFIAMRARSRRLPVGNPNEQATIEKIASPSACVVPDGGRARRDEASAIFASSLTTLR